MASPRPTVLIAAFGSTLRSDDAAGPEVLKLLEQELAANAGPETALHYELRVMHEPLPELAADLAQTDYAIFVDASVELPAGEISVEPLKPSVSAIPGHSIGLSDMLAACETLYGRFPQTVLLAIGAKQFDFGEALSPELQPALPRAVSLIRAELERISALSS